MFPFVLAIREQSWLLAYLTFGPQTSCSINYSPQECTGFCYCVLEINEACVMHI